MIVQQTIRGMAHVVLAALTILSVVIGRQVPAADLSQVFMVPLPEDQVAVALETLHPNTGLVITSVTSAVVVGDDTIVTYDQWEDGYETDLGQPGQSSTLVWGDGDPSNGDASVDGVCAPAIACEGDRLKAGATFTLKNDVPLPRDPTLFLWDGRDRIGTNDVAAVTRAAWGVQPGPVLSGAVEIYPTSQFGTDFEIPIGEDVPLPDTVEMFEYVGFMIMAGDQSTVVTIDTDGPSGADSPFDVSLGPGEGYHVHGGVQVGATVTSSSPIQTHIVTGNIGARYESRWFTLYPTSQWGSSAFSPVGTTNAKHATYVFLYNPSTNNTIQVDYETLHDETGTISINPRTTSRFKMPHDSGAQFTARMGERFFAVSTVGVNLAAKDNDYHDWGFSLVPDGNLRNQAAVAWGPGSDPLQPLQHGSTLWLTAVRDDTIVYIDWAGDGGGNFESPNGERYDQAIEIDRLQSVSVMAPDLDNTAARMFTTDGAAFTVVWGQNPAVSGSRNPFLDMGTTVLPIQACGVTIRKGETIDSSLTDICCLETEEDLPQTGEETVATVVRVRGETMVSSGADHVPAIQGMSLRVDDRIMTLADSEALLLFDNGCSYELGPEEVLTIGSSSPCCLLGWLPGSTGQALTTTTTPLELSLIPPAAVAYTVPVALITILAAQEDGSSRPAAISP